MDLRSSIRQKAWDTDDDNDDIIDEDNEIFFNQGFTSNVSPRSGSTELSLLRGSSLPPRTKHQKFLFHGQQHQLSTPSTTAQQQHHQQQQQFQSLPPQMYHRQSSQPSGPTNRRLASRNKSDHHARVPQSKSFSGVDRTHPYPRDGMTDQTDSSTPVSPFSGINLRWRSDTINTGSDTGSIKKPRRPSRKKVSRAISELQNSVFGDSLPYGAGWMANPVTGRRLESVGSQTNSRKSSADIEDSDLHKDHHNSFSEPRDQRPGFRSSSVRSEGLQPLNSIMKKDSFSHHPRLQQRVSYNDDYNSPHSHRLPEIHESRHDHHHRRHDDIHQQAAHGFQQQQQHQLQQQQHVQPQRHDSRHHKYDSIHQPREIPAEHHEMVSIYSSTPSLYNPNIRLAKDLTTSLRPESPALSQTLSSYNFNNRVRPKRESHPKNMEDFDLSIKNEFERLRKEYDKNETIDQSSYNRFPNKDKDKKLSKNDRTNLNHKPSSVKFNSDPIEDYPSHNDDDYGFIEAYKPSNQKRVGFDPDSGLDLPEGHGSQLKLREDYDNQQKQRKRNHVIFLVIVLVIVAVAVASAVLAVTLGSTNGHAKKTSENYSVVMATMTLKILNRKFQDELLVFGSDTFQSLAAPYSTELDELFLRSNLSSVYSNNKITSFRNGSIYATSSITFLDEGLITSPQDVENVIRSADVARDWKMEDALQLGEFVVCRSCAETKLEYVSVKEKPEVLLLNLDPQIGESKDANSVGDEKTTTDSPKELPTSHTSATTTHHPILSTEKVQSSNTTTTTSTTTIVAAAKSTTSETFTNTTTAFGKTARIIPTTEAPNKSQSSSVASSENEPAATAAALTSVSNSLSESSSPASTFPSTTTTTTTTTSTTTSEVRTTTSPNTFSTTSAAAPFITEKSENVTDAPTVVRVSSVNATTRDSHVLVTCDIINPNDWSVVNVLHTSAALSSNAIQTTETIVRLDTSNLYVTATISKLYKDRVRVIYDVSSSRIAIKINITALSCYDDGYVECSLAGRTLSRTSSRGRLEVTTAPSQPRLKIPTELVANRQISEPITCQADLGYPPWNLKLTAQVPGTTGSYVVPVQTDSVVDGCKEYVTLKFARYIPSLTANGTIVNCKLEKGDNSPRPQEVKTEQGILLVVSESICRGRADQTKLRHPQNCSLWILCIDQQPHVNSCPRGLCYDTMSGHCGAKSIIIETKDGILNNGLASITCSAVHVNDWSEIYIRRADSITYTYDVVSVSAQGNITWHDSSLGMRAMATHRFSVVEDVLQLWIYVLKCGDAGTYRCSVMQGNGLTMERETQLRVLAKAQPPTLTVPSRAAVEISQPVNITCEANLGQPPATLTLMRKLPNSYTYHTVTTTEDTTLVLSPCMQMQRKIFTTSTWALANQTVFRCDVTSSFDNSDLAAHHSVEQEYVELPNDTCKGLGPTLLPHPTDCRHFVQCALSETSVLTCGAGLCFNETSHQCDVLLANRADVTMNLCLGKADGHYLPHPSLCNKYIRCELGKAKIQHCPQSEVYYKDGLCTQFIHLSHCFKKSLE